jgi:uncharacterized membrane protein
MRHNTWFGDFTAMTMKIRLSVLLDVTSCGLAFQSNLHSPSLGILSLFLFSSIGVCVVMLVVCFSAWGEGFFLAVQTAIIGALVPFFARSAKEAVLFTISYLAVCVILMGGYTPVNVLWSLQALNVPIICVSKVSAYFRKKKK